MGNEDVGEEAFFYALYEDDYNWDKQADDLFLGMWGSNEYDHRYNAQSPIGKYLIPIDCFFLPTVEEIMNKFAEVPQFTDVRFAYEMAPSGIPAHEYWTVENGKIAGIADGKEDEFDQFYTVTVVGRQVGETVITVQHGGGSRICYATCTVKVVEQSPETPTDIIWGDVNEDTKVDAKDALQVLKYAVQKTELTAKQQLAAEVDGKEGINAKDALEILKYSVKKIIKFPIEEVAETPTDVTPTDA